MAIEETHIHWGGEARSTVTVAGQELELTSEVSNLAATARADPIGTIRVRSNGSAVVGLAIPTDDWEDIPDTDPVLQANAGSCCAHGYIRIRETDGRFVVKTGDAMTEITNIDPGTTGKYSALVAANVSAPSVRREADDLCRLQGRIAVSAAGVVSGDVIMVVPAAFIPGRSRWMSTTNSGGIAIPCEIIAATGQVIARHTQAGAANLAFDDVVYKTSTT
jgi:hypothetical protein